MTVLGHAPYRRVDCRHGRVLPHRHRRGVDSASEGARQAADARCDDRRAQEGSRQSHEQALVSDRVKQLAEREAQLQQRCAAQRASIAREIASIEARFERVDRIAGVARTTLLHPAVIVGGIVALLTIGRLRGMRLVGRLYLLEHGRAAADANGQGVSRARQPNRARCAGSSYERVAVGRVGGRCGLRASARRRSRAASRAATSAYVCGSRIPRISCSCRARSGSSRAAWPRAPGSISSTRKPATAALLPFAAQHDADASRAARRRRRRSR